MQIPAYFQEFLCNIKALVSVVQSKTSGGDSIPFAYATDYSLSIPSNNFSGHL